MKHFLRESSAFSGGGVPVTGREGSYDELPGWTGGPVYSVIEERNASSEDSRLDLRDLRQLVPCHLGELSPTSDAVFVYEKEGAVAEFMNGSRLLLRVSGLPGGFKTLEDAHRDMRYP